MEAAAETLMFPYRRGLLAPPEGRVLFLNAVPVPELKQLERAVLVQPRYDKARLLPKEFLADIDALPAPFDTVWILPSKDLEETQYLLAAGLLALKEDGLLVAAAENDGGGKRLAGLFEQLGLAPQSESKNKARVVYAPAVTSFDRTQAETWRRDGESRAILSENIISCPGLHGWDKIDTGSALLAHVLPHLHGHVADFGCGWGYLSLQAAEKGAARLTLIDIDSRAVRLAERNIKNTYARIPVAGLWTDLAHPEKPLGPFDTILLNPPFHIGTRAAPGLGQAIIATAARALDPQGTLYLVANLHLPYEKTLRELFSRVELKVEEQGFKVFACGR